MYRTHGPGGRHPDAADAVLTRCGPSRTRRSTGRRLTRAIRGTACAAVAAWAAAASGGEVTSVDFTSSPAEGNTYVALPGPRADQIREPENIEITVRFDEAVTVTGAPAFTLIVGRANRAMRYDPDADVLSNEMLFRYTVRAGDLDADGVGWAADPLRGGSIVSGDPAAAVDRAIDANARTEAHRVDAVAPSVERVWFTSNAGTDRVYGFGEDIEITVGFDEPVTATGVELALTVGGEDHALTPAPASEGALLVFRYTVQEGDEDTNGVSVAANALTIADADGSVADGAGNAANLGLRGLPNGAAHRVDGIAPTVPGAPRVVSTPRAGGAYQAGEWIEVALDFSENVVASSGELTLLVGDPDNEIERARSASYYESGSSGRRVVFRYAVQDDDMDGDGVSVRAGAVNDHGVTDVAGNSWNGTHPAMPEQRSHRVGTPPADVAAVAGAPVVTTVGPYAAGESIVVEVRFTAPVYVSTSDDPVAFRMRIGDAVRQMAYQDGTGSQTLRFAYEVVAGEADDDGIAYDANALVGSGGITDDQGRPADRTLRPARLSAHLVDGVAPTLRPTNAVEIVSDPGADETYRVGDTIAVTVAFSEPVEVVHGPDLTLALQFDRTDVTAAATLAGGEGTDRLEFRYTVQDGDTDSNGAGVAGLSGGDVRDLAGNPLANPAGVTLPQQSGHRVDGTGPGTAAPRIVSTAGSDQTYSTGDRIEVEIAFNEDIEVSGEPVLLLSIGSLNRRATLLRTRPRLLVFGYTVQDGDLDTDGVSIAPDALGIAGTITDRSGNPVDRTLQALEPQGDHKVDAVPPAVAGMDIRSNPEDAEVGYQIGEPIEVAVTFDEVVHVTSDPESDEPLQLMISIGAAARPADYVAGSGTETLVFRYTVQLGDSDLDGISIGPDALVGGVIEDAAGTDFEEEDRRIPPVPQQPGHRVNALGAPVILPQEQDGQDGIVITPPGDGTFGIGEAIIVEVTFGRAVFVTGNPVLTLSIGAQSRAAALHDGSGTATLTFHYVVQVDDRDGDGISVPANALQLSGQGTITDADGNAALLDHPGLPADSRLRVDGGGVGVQDVAHHHVRARPERPLRGRRRHRVPRGVRCAGVRHGGCRPDHRRRRRQPRRGAVLGERVRHAHLPLHRGRGRYGRGRRERRGECPDRRPYRGRRGPSGGAGLPGAAGGFRPTHRDRRRRDRAVGVFLLQARRQRRLRTPRNPGGERRVRCRGTCDRRPHADPRRRRALAGGRPPFRQRDEAAGVRVRRGGGGLRRGRRECRGERDDGRRHRGRGGPAGVARVRGAGGGPEPPGQRRAGAAGAGAGRRGKDLVDARPRGVRVRRNHRGDGCFRSGRARHGDAGSRALHRSEHPCGAAGRG